MKKWETNWTLGLNYYTPSKGEKVWRWSEGDALSGYIEDVRMVGGLPEVFTGLYFSNDYGRAYIKNKGIYLNEYGGSTRESLLEKFTSLEVRLYFNRHWISCRRISYPNQRSDMFVQRATFEQLVGKINELTEE